MATNIIITRESIEVSGSAVTTSPTPWQLYVAVGVGVLFAAMLFKPFFKDWSGFWACLVFWMKPDWISWWQGEGVEDWWAELKLGAWLAISAGCGFLAYFQLPKMLPGLFGP